MSVLKSHAALLAAGLATAWAAPQAEAVTIVGHDFQGSISPTTSLSNAAIVYGYNLNSSAIGFGAQYLGSVPAGTSTPYNVTVYDSEFVSFAGFTIMAIYDAPDPTGDGASVTLAFAPESGIAGQTFEAIFGENSEAALAADIAAFNSADMIDFYDSHRGQLNAYIGWYDPSDPYYNTIPTSELYNFSAATLNGSVSAYVLAPEPASLALAGGLGIALLRRRRR